MFLEDKWFAPSTVQGDPNCKGVELIWFTGDDADHFQLDMNAFVPAENVD